MKDLPFDRLSIHHMTTREVRTLDVVSTSEDEVVLNWPMAGHLHFNAHSGRGLKKHTAWWLTPESFAKVKDARKVKVSE